MVQLMLLGALAVLLLAAAASVRRGAQSSDVFLPALAVGLSVLLGSVAGAVWPAVERALRVEPHAVGSGEVWRLVTATVVQDGGLGGTVFNLVVLAAAVPLAARALGPGRATLTFWLSAVVLNAVAAATGTTVAGSSGATFAMLGAAAVAALLGGASPRWPAPAALALAAVVWVTGDAHGAAVLLGALVGVLVGVLVGRRADRRYRAGTTTSAPHEARGPTTTSAPPHPRNDL